MNEPSLSIFTIEADRKPVLVFDAKKHRDAEIFFRDESVRTKLRSISARGIPICDNLSILRLRLANTSERTRFRAEATTTSEIDRAAVFLIEIDKE